MRIVNLGFGKKRLVVEPTSNLSKVKELYSENEHRLELEGEFDSMDFLKSFVKLFYDIKSISISNWGLQDHSFIYKLKTLDSLSFGAYQKELDLSKLPQLKSLSIDYEKRYILNLKSQKELEHLSISDFTEKDFKRIPSFDNLKSFMSIGGKLKTLENIEAIKNIQALEISAHRGLSDISAITALKELKFIEINSCWKMADFSPLAELKKLEVVHITDCKNLESIKFVKELSKLKQLYTLGTTIINDFDTTPAANVPIFFGSQHNKYNKQYPEKEIKEGQKTWSNYT